MSPAHRSLTERVAGVRAYLHRRAALATALWLLTGVALVLLIAWAAAGEGGWAQGSNVPLVLDALMLAWVVAGLAFFRARALRWFGEVPLARSIERAAGLEDGTVRGSLELARSSPPGVSDALAARAVARTASGLEGRHPRDLAGDLGQGVALWTRRGMIGAVFAVLALVALGVAAPERAANAWAGVSAPLRTMADPPVLPILVSPGSVEVMRGADVLVEIEAQGRTEVRLVWQPAGDVARSERLEVREGRAAHVLEAVSAATEYRVETEDGTRTETWVLTPVDPLFVSDLVTEVEYPAHTGLGEEEYRGDPPPLRLPAGSRLTFQGTASRPLSEAALADSAGGSAVRLSVEDREFGGAWTPAKSGVYTWSFLDASGASAEVTPGPLDIFVVPDAVPEVAILVPGRDTVLPLSLRQPLVVDARDDYGLARFELVAYRVTSFGERQEPVVQAVDLQGTRAALARPALDLSTWGLLPGDTVRYFVRVVDNSPAGQVGVSAEYALRMPAAAELRREAGATLDSVAVQLDELRAEAARQAEANAEQAREAAMRRPPAGERRAGSGPDFERREELARALEEQAAMLSELDSLRADLEVLQRTLEEAGQADPELAAQLQELQEMLRKMDGGALRERMEELAEAIRQNATEASRSLDELAAEQERFREQLETALEQFRRAALEQDFRATTEEARDLARQERALADAMREGSEPDLRSEQQRALADRADQLDARMQELAERLTEMGEERAASGVEEASRQADDARRQMRDAERMSAQGAQPDAADRAEQASARMQEAAASLERAQSQMAEETAERAQAAMNQAADDALALARRQAELTERMAQASTDDLAGMRGDQAALLRGLQNVAGNVQEGTRATGGDPALSAQLGRAMQSMEDAIQELESRNGSPREAAARAEQAVGSLNQLAMMAMASAEQIGSVGAGRSGQDVVEQVGQLAQRQGRLLAQTGELMPMRLGEQALQQQLGSLSERQQSVARDLEQVSGEPGAADALGDLEALAREADALAQELAGGRLTPEVVQRQEQLFHRLLDAGRSLEQEEYSDEREATRPGAFERGEVAPLTAEQLGLLPYELPDAEQLRRLTPAVRQLVLEYFERLNRAPAREERAR